MSHDWINIETLRVSSVSHQEKIYNLNGDVFLEDGEVVAVVEGVFYGGMLAKC